MKQDLREAARFLAANPGFTAIVVFTLGLAIGVNSTIFSVLNGVLLRPLDYADPDRLAGLWESNQAEGLERSEVSAATYIDWRERTRSFEKIGIYRYRGFTLTREDEAERVSSVDVSPALFELLGVRPLIGRGFSDNDERPGSERQVLLSHGAWTRRFGQDPQVTSQTLQLDSATHTIVGVMPKNFRFPPDDEEVEMWSPLTLDLTALASRPHRMYHAIGRLAPGTTLRTAREDMAAVAAGVARENPDTNAGWGVTIVPAHEQVVGDISETLWLLFAAVVLVLLIACANIANLLLARSARAGRDFAIRSAFGAGRWVLLRRSLVESAVLTMLGAAVGLAIAWWGIRALRPLIPATVPRASTISLDWSVLAFTAIAAIAAGLMFGLVPAWRAMRPNVMEVLQEGSRGSTASRASRRLADAMVIAEVALALMLLVSAGLLIRSFVRLSNVDPGYRTSGIVATHVVLPRARYGPPAAKRQFLDDLVERVRRLEGVQRASAVSALPMSPLGVQFDLPFTIDGLDARSPSERPRARYRAVMSGYFQTMEIELKRGRVFDSFDGRENGPKVAIVNESLVRRYFGGMDPIDKLVRMPMAGDLHIVGVVSDIRHDSLEASAEAEVFVPYMQFPLSEMQIVMATNLAPGVVVKNVKRAIAELDPALPIAKASAMEDLVSASIAQPRFNTTLLAALALCAALLAAVGVYGVVTYSVTRRTSEIGVRMALGADAERTFKLVVLGALKVVLAGVALGFAGAAAAGRSLQNLLFGVPPLDAVTFAASGLAIMIVAAIAASVPAQRASRIDPVRALRQD
ncbi:MAG TPA: ABC transporter permease [Vicinamibacterales bacterium]|nr:ABC transporter permease [Vicinamibacterales bacterium]